MKHLLLVGEDALCCALGMQLLLKTLPDWQLAAEPINKKGVEKLKASLPRYVNQAKHVQPVICIADTDGQCAALLRQAWLPHDVPNAFQLRLAVTEAESWLLADHEAVVNAWGVPISKLPRAPDTELDPKLVVLDLAKRSRVRLVRREVVSESDPTKPGTGYNQHVCQLAREHWSAQRAAERSPSLARAIRRVKELGKLAG